MSTFLTDSGCAPTVADAYPVLASIDSGQKTIKCFMKLQELISDLPEHLNSLMSKHENECFLTYKTHMHGIAEEFESLRTKQASQERMIRKDANLCKMEDELEWFMREALRLDELGKGYLGERNLWRAKVHAGKEDCSWLESEATLVREQIEKIKNAMEIPTHIQPVVSIAKVSSPPIPRLSPPTQIEKTLLTQQRLLHQIKEQEALRFGEISRSKDIFQDALKAARAALYRQRLKGGGHELIDKLIADPQALARLHLLMFGN